MLFKLLTSEEASFEQVREQMKQYETAMKDPKIQEQTQQLQQVMQSPEMMKKMAELKVRFKTHTELHASARLVTIEDIMIGMTETMTII